MLRTLVGMMAHAAAGGGGGGVVTWEPTGGGSSVTSSTLIPGYPASPATGDLFVLIVGQKPSSANAGSVDTPSGWTALASLTGAGGYGATLTTNQGNTNIFAFYKESDGTETGNLSVTINDNSAAWAVIHRLSKSGGTWDVAAATGEDAITGDFNVPFTSDPGVQANDFIIVGMVIATAENIGSHFASPALSQSGVTFGTVTEVGEFSLASGNRVAGATWRSPVTAGTSGGNPTYTGTENFSTSHGKGAAVFIRIRAV
jgi:hypothetical protein